MLAHTMPYRGAGYSAPKITYRGEIRMRKKEIGVRRGPGRSAVHQPGWCAGGAQVANSNTQGISNNRTRARPRRWGGYDTKSS